MNIIEDFIPLGRKNRPANSNPCDYITIHNTGNSSRGANAKSHASYVKSDTAANAFVSWHYTVDDTVIYQHLPDNETAYHAGDGSGSGNTRSIGIEICMNSDGDLLKATNNATELAASLCKTHSIPVANIVQHYNWSGKNCPQMLRDGRPYNWNTFLSRVNSILTTVPPAIGPGDTVRFDLFNKVVNIRGKLIDNVNFVAADKLLEAIGFTVNWNAAAQTMIVRIPDSTVRINLFGDKTVNIPGGIISDRNYVVLNNLMEAMGLKTEWIQETYTTKVSLSNDTVRINLFGDEIVNIPGRIISGRNFVALYALMEAMRLETEWVPETQTVKINLSGTTVKVDLFGDVVVDLPGRLISGRNFVAIYALMEAMGLEIEWLPELETVRINNPQNQ